MKKVFLSLAALAMVAVGTVSCGSDDSSPTPPVVDDTPGGDLTENFIKLGNDSFPLEYTWLGYESDQNVEGEDFLEQALNPNDPSKLYIVWRFNSLTEDVQDPEASYINMVATEVDQTQTGNARYKLPFTEGSNTVRVLAVAVANGTQYVEGQNDEVTLELGENFSYADGSENVAYVMGGTLQDTEFNVDIDHALDMLYYIEVNPSAASKGVSNKDFSVTKKEKAGTINQLGLKR